MTENIKGKPLVVSQDYSKFAGVGLEGAPPPPLPMLKIIHATMKGVGVNGDVLENAHPGELYLTDPPLLFTTTKIIPCNLLRVWLEWETREPKQSPPVAAYSMRPVDAKWIPGEGLRAKNGHYLFEDRCFYVLVADAETKFHRAALHMNKTNIAVSNDWLRVLQQKVKHPSQNKPITPPIFARQFTFGTEKQANESFSWWGWKLLDAGEFIHPTSPVFDDARQFYSDSKELMQQMSIIDPSAYAKGVADDDIPF